MIKISDKVCHIEGSMSELLEEWCELTKMLFKNTCKATGIGRANKLFVDMLFVISKESVDEIREEEEDGD